MTSVADRRLAKLETALSPRGAVLAWLVEAQQFPTLEAHARSIADLPVEAAPLSVIGERVEAAVRASLKGQPRDAIERAVRRAVGDGVFMFTLVLQINVQALEFARLEGLRASAVFFWMGALSGGPRAADLPPDEARTYERQRANAWTQWRAVVDRLTSDVRVENEARASIERRFFGGHDVFFADAGQAWAEHVDLVERLAGLAEVMASTGKPTGRRQDGQSGAAESIDARVTERAARLADDARVRAFGIIGERERGVAIMERRLLGHSPTHAD